MTAGKVGRLTGRGRRSRWLALAGFGFVLVINALYVRHAATEGVAGWADKGIVDNGLGGFRPYLRSGDYYTGFSYALAVAFSIWALAESAERRRAALAAGAEGGVSLAALLAPGGCFLAGCCGSPMLAVYLGIFGAKALGAGKPLMAGITLISTGAGYFYLARRFRPDPREGGIESPAGGIGTGGACGPR